MNTLDKEYRHELKFIINNGDIPLLKKKLSLFMKEDEHYDGEYFIRSLYFDDIYHSAYYDKLNGTKDREKYRIRFYNFDKSFISLELKGKNNNLSYKKRCNISLEEYNYLLRKDYSKIDANDRELLSSFIFDLKTKNLVPVILVDYNREAYTYEFEDVRITFDRDVRSANYNDNMFDQNSFMKKVFDDDSIILEVKYNDRLPSFINDIIKNTRMIKIGISKYVLCIEREDFKNDL